ncbi:MAG: DUF2238 domain-containing protein [Rhizobiaceae bacterium]|nr:MAG: DUF2238 domain-containing protein [Rhizobiaceae bacterium]
MAIPRRIVSLPSFLLGLYSVTWITTALDPVSRKDWALENLLVAVAVPLLILTHSRFRLSDRSYLCLFAFFTLHAIGAHYTYAFVPYDAWFEASFGRTLSDVAGWQRNHYDRLVHFAYGALVLPASCELIGGASRPRDVWRWTLPITFVMSHSVLYETAEWAATLVVSPELGIAYLGSQGDQWDAQKDSALAAAGACLSMAMIAAQRSFNDRFR